MTHTLVGSCTFCIFQEKLSAVLEIKKLGKIRYFVSLQVLVQLSYTLIYPFLTYSLITWGNTNPTSLQPLITLQKKKKQLE